MKNNKFKPIKLYSGNSTQYKSVKLIYRLSRYTYNDTYKEKKYPSKAPNKFTKQY